MGPTPTSSRTARSWLRRSTTPWSKNSTRVLRPKSTSFRGPANFGELRHGEVRRMPSSEKSCSRTLAEYSAGRKGTANLVAGRGRVPARAALGKDEPDDDAGVVIRHPDEDAYFVRQPQWRAGVANRGPGPAERATVQGEDIFFHCCSSSCGGTRLPRTLLRYSSAPNGC